MQLHVLAFLLSLTIHACALSKLTTGGPTDPNDPIYQAVDRLTDRLMNTDQPLVNDAVSGLPPQAQQLAQTAFVALQEAIDQAAAQAVAGLTPAQHARAVNVTNDLATIARILHETIHDPNAATIVPTP